MNMDHLEMGEILLISSDRALTGDMMDCVDTLGFMLISIESSERAVAAFSNNPPVAIFLDIKSFLRPGELHRVAGNFPDHTLIIIGNEYSEIRDMISANPSQRLDYILLPLIPELIMSRILISSGKSAIAVSAEKVASPGPEVRKLRNSFHIPSRPSIIVVDDEEDVVVSVKRYLDTEGYEVCTATTPARALELCAERSLDIAFIDIDLIETTGNILFEQMKNIQPDLKCVFITGRASVESAAEAVGANGVLSYELKPFKMTRLNEFVIEAMIARLSEDSIRRYTDIINNIHTGLHVYRISEDGKELTLLDANPEAEKILGWNISASAGKTFSEVWHSSNLDGEPESFISLLTRGKSIMKDNITFNLSGVQRFLSLRMFSMPGRCVGVAFEDITEVKTALHELKIFKTIADKAKIGTVICDMTGTIIYANNEFAIMHGYSIEDITKKSIRDFHMDQSTENLNHMMMSIFQDGGFSSREIWRRKKDGTIFPALVSATGIKDENNNNSLLTATMSDISDQYRDRKIIEDSEARYRAVLDNMKHCVAIFTPLENGKDFICVEFNKSAEEIEDLSRDKVVDKKITTIFPGIKEFGLLDVMMEVSRTGESEFFPATIYNDERISGWRENFVFKLSSGEIVCIYDDVTDRKKAELALVQSEEHFRSQFKGFPAPTLLWKKKGDVFELINYNDAASLMTDGEISAMAGISCEKLFANFPGIREKIWECYHEMENQREEVYFSLLPGKPAGNYDVHYVNLSPDIVMQNMIDITEIREAEKSIKNSEEKLRALSHRIITVNEEERGRLSRELHDELGQQLTALRWGLEKLIKESTDVQNTTVMGNLKNMLSGATDELRRICRGLRPQLLDDMGLPIAIRSLIETAAHEMNLDIVLHMSEDENSPIKEVSSEIGIIMYRVLQEAITNAAKHANAKQVVVTLSADSSTVQLLVVDDGKGFDPAGSDQNEAAGLGITGMKERAALCGGTFTLDSSPGTGTKIKLEMPIQYR